MRALAALSRFVGNTFAYWVLLFAVIAFLQPAWFLGLKSAIVPLLGLVMFGMGLTLKLDDFAAPDDNTDLNRTTSAHGLAQKLPNVSSQYENGVGTFEQLAGPVTTATDGATVTFALATSRRQIVTLGGNRTLALSGDTDGMMFTIILKQDGTGSRTVTWWAGIKWSGGTTPTLTTTASKMDVFSFWRIASGEYIGFTGSLNH